MTDKEQIIIDGVDVKNCRRRIGKNNYCRYFKRLCSENNFNCVWKQLARKTQIIDEVEEVIKPYQEQIELDALSLPIAIESILERKTQECDIWKNQVLIIDEEAVTVEVTQKQFEEYLKLKQECEKLSILAQEESARNAYIEYELNDKLKQKTQECENLKAEEKYLKQCCEKAGEELAKHSFDYDGKEKNLVVQAMELNEKYEKLEKALEEIEEYTKSFSEVDLFEDIKDIINKAKDGNAKCKLNGTKTIYIVQRK